MPGSGPYEEVTHLCMNTTVYLSSQTPGFSPRGDQDITTMSDRHVAQSGPLWVFLSLQYTLYWLRLDDIQDCLLDFQLALGL